MTAKKKPSGGWDKYTPEQRAERIRRANLARRENAARRANALAKREAIHTILPAPPSSQQVDHLDQLAALIVAVWRRLGGPPPSLD